MIILLAYNWRLISDALGFAIARGRGNQKKKRRSTSLVVWIIVWLVAIEVLFQRCGGKGIFCGSPSPTSPLTVVQNFVSGPGPGPAIPGIQLVTTIGQIIQTSWFGIAFLGFLAVSAVIIARGLKVSWDERVRVIMIAPELEVEGRTAIEEAIQIIESQDTPDPRERIIRSYERMVLAAQRLGAPVTSDQTARELRTAIRKMLLLRGPSMDELTKLFEEARYSLHPMTDVEAEQAHRCLLDIYQEIKLPVIV